MRNYIGVSNIVKGQKIMLIVTLILISILFISTDLTSESLPLYIIFPFACICFNLWASRFFSIYVEDKNFVINNLYYKKIIIPINEFKEIRPFISLAGGYKIVFKNGRKFLFSQGSTTRAKYYYTLEFSKYIEDVTAEIKGLTGKE